jgi:hypothetical protein
VFSTELKVVVMSHLLLNIIGKNGGIENTKYKQKEQK